MLALVSACVVVFLLSPQWALADNNLFGLVTRDAAFLTTTSTFRGPSGVVMQGDTEWITPLAGGRSLLGIRGNPSDCAFLRARIEAACSEHLLNFNERPLACDSIAHLCRSLIAKNMRSSPLEVTVLIAGWDDVKNVPVLYWLDEIGAIQQVPYAAHGREFSFVFSVLDRVQTLAKGLLEVDASITADASATGAMPATRAFDRDREAAAVSTTSNAQADCKPLLEMSAVEGLRVIDACWSVIDRRAIGHDDKRAGTRGIAGTASQRRGRDHLVRIYGVTKQGVVDYTNQGD